MVSNMFRVCGNEKDKNAVLGILEAVSRDLHLDELIVLGMMDSFWEDAEGDAFVVKAQDREKVPFGKKLFTYGERMGESTVVALNPQRREHSSSFEILTDDFMGRAYLPLDSQYTTEQVMVAFTMLLAAGAEASKVLAKINEFTKEKD